MGDNERRPLPAILLMILALFGLASLQNPTGSGPRPAADAAQKGEKAAAPADLPQGSSAREAVTSWEARVLEPLLDDFRVNVNTKDPLGTARAATGRDPARGLRVLIATVPNPVRSTNSHRFDEWIGAIQRACESEGFVLGGFRLPWRAAAKEPAAGSGADRAPPPAAQDRNRASSYSVASRRRFASSRCWPCCSSRRRPRSASTSWR